MSYANRFSVLQEKSNAKVAPAAFANTRYPVPAPSGPSYKSWKNKEVTADGKAIKKEVNISSFSDFPDLVRADPKKTSAFTGTSLAAKLKEVIAAEEEAAILKRIKKGETPEDIFRESCVILPLKGGNPNAEPEFKAPWWVTDTSNPIVMPPFTPRSYEQQKQERFYRRYGINPAQTMLFDAEVDEYAYIEEQRQTPILPDDEESLCEPVEAEAS